MLPPLTLSCSFRPQSPDLLETSSELIYCGELTKVNSSGWSQERIFFLFDFQIIYCKKVSSCVLLTFLRRNGIASLYACIQYYRYELKGQKTLILIDLKQKSVMWIRISIIASILIKVEQ